MRKVELVNGIFSSALGFGCAPILGSVGEKVALRALRCAIDSGITHFDLARSYGYGDTEKFVGKVVKGKRDQLILASKYGIVANWKAKIFRPAKPIARFVLDNIKTASQQQTTRAVIGQSSISNSLHTHLQLDGKEMRKSLEKTLRALGTDYLDYFFLHEPLEQITNIEELTDVSEMLKAEGKIRAWGLAYMRSQENLHKKYLHLFDVLQFDNSPYTQGYESLVADRGEKGNIFFSPLKGGLPTLKPAEKLNILFKDFPSSVILCSMFNEKHLKENVELVV